MEQNRKNAKNIYRFALFLLLLLIPIIILYLWNNTYTLSAPIDNGKFGTFGDFVGGVLGSIWSLCGILLFYSALREQREDFRTNSDALLKQVDALEIQSEEFRLQREELSQSRQVFIEQAKTQRQQRFESTYFSLLELYTRVTSDLNLQSKNNNYFKSLKSELFKKIPQQQDPIENYEFARKNYLEIFYNQKEELSHYFKLIYRILKIIDDSEVIENEKFRYIKILRSQLSENEMFAIYYNSHSVYGGESYKLILKYNLLKHLPCTSKIEFAKYLYEINENGKIVISNATENSFTELNSNSSFLLGFNYELTRLIRNFLLKLTDELKGESFEHLKESYNLPLCDDIIVGFYSMESYELTIEISTTLNDFDIIASLKRRVFIQYFEAFLYDSFVFSRYKDTRTLAEFIQITETENRIKFEIKSDRRLSINTDME
jgi:hypothetical protein